MTKPASIHPTLYLLKSWLLLWCSDIYFFKGFIWPGSRVWHWRLHHLSLCCGLKGCCGNLRWICYKLVIDCVVTLVRRKLKETNLIIIWNKETETRFTYINWFFKDSKFTLTLSLPYLNAYYYPYCLPYILYFLICLTDFQNFLGLLSPGKCYNKIPGLCRFFRMHTNPVWKQCQL